MIIENDRKRVGTKSKKDEGERYMNKRNAEKRANSDISVLSRVTFKSQTLDEKVKSGNIDVKNRISSFRRWFSVPRQNS